MRRVYFSKKFRTLTIVTAFSLMTIFSIRGFNSGDLLTKAKGSNQVEIEIKNETKSLQVISKASITESLISLSVKNSSDKAMTAFVVAFGKNRVTEEFIHDERKFILPGNTCTRTYPISSREPSPEFTIRAVVFDDGTGEGNINDVRAITETRSGQGLQYKRFLAALKEVENTPELQLPFAWNELRDKVSSLPDGKDESLPVNVRYGLHNGKQDLIDEVQSLDLNNASTHRIRLTVKYLKARYSKIAPRYNPNKDSRAPAREM